MYYQLFLCTVAIFGSISTSHSDPLNQRAKEEQALPRDTSISASDDYDHLELLKLTEFRQRHRKTINGALCAAAFIRNGNKFTDCTVTEAPDGSVGREWCYVEVQLIGTGARDWDFCAGVVDYDVLRDKAESLSRLRAMELEYAVRSLATEEKRLDGTVSKFDEVCGNEGSNLSPEISRIEIAIRGIERAVDQLKVNSASLGTLANHLHTLEDEVAASRKSAINNRKNCSIIRGYDEYDKEPDGLRASYYDNPYFRGYPQGFMDHPNINIIWEDFVPISGIPHESFSVRIEGYLRIPTTDVYTFYLKSDCNIRFFMDDEVIMSQGLDPNSDGALGPIVTLPLDGRKTTNVFLKSNPVHLTGGKRYPIILEYSHQKVLKYFNSDIAKIILSWSSVNRDEEVIPPECFFKGSGQSNSVTVSGLKGEYYTLAILENGAQAFHGTPYFLIADVPTKLVGTRMIRMPTKPPEPTISCFISNDAFFYVAIPTNSPYIPTTEDGTPFEKTSDLISVYGVGNYCTTATTQNEFTLYLKRYNKGNVTINIPYITSAIVFITPSIVNGICRGDISVLRFKPTDKCVASSYNSDSNTCENGFGNGTEDEDANGWITKNGNTTGEFITRWFEEMIELRYFHFKPKGALKATTVTFTFPDGSSEDFDLSDQLRYEFGTYRMVDQLRIEIKNVEEIEEAESTTGGIFTLFGIECKDLYSNTTDQPSSIDISFCADGTCNNGSNVSIVDSGATQSVHHGLYYGWDKRAKSDQCSYNTDVTAEKVLQNMNGLLLYDNKWSVDAPSHGKYRIKITVANLCNDSPNTTLTINGYSVLSGERLDRGQTLTVGLYIP
ncbi:hypothetical protein BEWA_034610 [Theileria equi strain WA]|uniref:PA14 domain-containing protein n=1 Tax=Theileria equi strain WA TaxID=1537102 RepID=L0AZB2_THEEQ|nr:hypothetical protein BEWA_034610 [Theileria equi strain WA]AFZ80603.1 hypothetical protein BEWA_034610 [Theileria equi strain WA]|eukprot:XP_004830269.1 hypothetical protein BEWA_034610 [Theileria equi strain WA]